MSSGKRYEQEGKETWVRLRDWHKSATAAERLSALILKSEGFSSIDPSHPLGGPDGGRDILCNRGDFKFVCACYFPRGEIKFAAIRKKFRSDLSATLRQGLGGFVFVTNQELTLSQRDDLRKIDASEKLEIEIIHLEKLTAILNTPAYYGVRLDFLNIEMNRDEQVAFFAERDQMLAQLADQLSKFLAAFEHGGMHLKTQTDELKHFKFILDSISGTRFFSYSLFEPGHIDKLRVPLTDLKEFKSILDEISGQAFNFSFSILQSKKGHISNLIVPLAEIREFSKILQDLTGADLATALDSALVPYGQQKGKVHDLSVPLKELEEYEKKLDQILMKISQLNTLKDI